MQGLLNDKAKLQRQLELAVAEQKSIMEDAAKKLHIVATERATSGTASPCQCSSSTKRKPRVAFLFPGQGAQYAGMGKGLYESIPAFRVHFDECSTVLKDSVLPKIRNMAEFAGLFLGQRDVSKIQEIFAMENDGTSKMSSTERQLSIFAVEYSLAKVLSSSWNVHPDIVGGHSLGEYTAAARCFEEAHRLEPGEPEYLIQAAKMKSRAGQHKETLPLLRKALSMDHLSSELGAHVRAKLAEVEAMLGLTPEAAGTPQTAAACFARLRAAAVVAAVRRAVRERVLAVALALAAREAAGVRRAVGVRVRALAVHVPVDDLALVLVGPLEPRQRLPRGVARRRGGRGGRGALARAAARRPERRLRGFHDTQRHRGKKGLLTRRKGRGPLIA